MSELARIFEKGIELSGLIDKTTPRLFRVQFDIVWLGNLLEGDSATIGLIPVEILNEHGEHGWLYGTHTLVVWNNFHNYAIRREDLKAYVEPIFKARQFSDEPKINHMQRTGKKVIGWIDSAAIPKDIIHPL